MASPLLLGSQGQLAPPISLHSASKFRSPSEFPPRNCFHPNYRQISCFRKQFLLPNPTKARHTRREIATSNTNKLPKISLCPHLNVFESLQICFDLLLLQHIVTVDGFLCHSAFAAISNESFQIGQLSEEKKGLTLEFGVRRRNQLLSLPSCKGAYLQGTWQRQVCCSCSGKNQCEEEEMKRENQTNPDNQLSVGVKLAIDFLRFYKREISPFLPGSCRYVPTCSEYAIQAYKTYGVLKGTILTAWRLIRCNPFGGSGFDPPRWFGEIKPPPY